MPTLTIGRKLVFKLCLIWLGAFVLISTYHVGPDPKVYYHRVFTPSKQKKWSKKRFVETAMSTSIDDPWDYKPINKLCAETEWRKGLTFICGPPQGGLGNVRNVVVNCIRYAIQGGGDLVLPQILKRDDKNIVKLFNGDRFTGDLREFSYMFDPEHAVGSLKVACPQMTIYKTFAHLKEQVEHPASATKYIDPQNFADEFVDSSIIADPKKWRETFDKWLNTTIPFASPASSPEWSAWIDINTPLLQFPQAYEPNVSRSLGRVVQLPMETRRLAATVLWELSKKFNLTMDPSATGIANNTYYGAHLRTAEDAQVAGFTPYNQQTSFYLSRAHLANLFVIYATSDNPKDVSRFAAGAYDSDQIHVVSKNDLLTDPKDKKALKRLSWDQQALVDYEVLVKASQFGGIHDSTFSAQVAVKRHTVSEVEDCYGEELEERVAWGDEFTGILGDRGANRRFFEAMWA